MQEIFSAIIAWHKQNRKQMPWREDPTPYHVWLSEIMLQQTRIEAVIPYYKRFLSALPTIESLAECDDDALMKLWQGLGYYSRARNLKKAARLVMERYGGELPADKKQLLKLPGVGDYTAGAISSIAFLRGEPAVDGNVLRVYMRLTEGEEDIADLSVRRRVCEILRKDYPVGIDARLLTEGIMELGEIVCIPNGEPKCKDCPVRESCLSHRHGTTDRYPVKAQKTPRKRVPRTVVLLACKGKIALQKRKEEGLLAGLYEFPCIEGEKDIHGVEEWLITQNIKAKGVQPMGSAVHIFTHLEWHMTGYFSECEEEGGDYQWFSKEEIDENIPIPTAYAAFQKKLWKKL